MGTLIVACGLFASTFLVLLMATAVAPAFDIPTPLTVEALYRHESFGLAVMLLSVALVLPVVLGSARFVQGRRPGTLSSITGRLRWRQLLRYAGLAVVSLTLGVMTQAIVFHATGLGSPIDFGWAGWDRAVPALTVIVLLVPFQATAEEYMFRGWLIQAFGTLMKSPWPGIVAGSLLFASLHGYTGWGPVDVFSFGMVMGWLTVRTCGLEAAIAMHVLNNLVAFAPGAAAGELSEAMRQGAVPWQSLTGTAVQLSSYVVAVTLCLKTRPR
ncbi:CPBP family intramembrane glutamic endopeptidase [Nonomuraea turcica]|uniref:CPBP family intramembrane glutamic endopeptidase n=1 Tax=Nonomuraea sp. G32 TaxID=3067274 RepID=UPI00273A8626|nr:CPBP family intramembrane glutamic endopeptidase [Nonomuraea sp. G32]MDP4504180.1 CPBP family intramembrane metalloprotease [Nonomuraea sp. G32]